MPLAQNSFCATVAYSGSLRGAVFSLCHLVLEISSSREDDDHFDHLIRGVCHYQLSDRFPFIL